MCIAPPHGTLSSEAKAQGAPLTPLDALNSVAQQGSPRLMQADAGLPACHPCTVSFQRPGTSFHPLLYSACSCILPYCFLAFLSQRTLWQTSAAARRCLHKAVMSVAKSGCLCQGLHAMPQAFLQPHHGTHSRFSPISSLPCTNSSTQRPHDITQ